MEVIKMKNRIKYLTLFTIMFIFSACSGLFKFKPYFITFVYSHGVYGILENEKVNRMGVPKNNIDKMDYIISNKYGIKFNTGNRIYANEDSRTFYNIKEYSYPAPVDITKTNDDSYILEIGEIEILDKNGKVIKAKEKIPPLVFKKIYYRVLIKSYGGSEDIYYRGWAEDYPKDPSTLKKIY